MELCPRKIVASIAFIPLLILVGCGGGKTFEPVTNPDGFQVTKLRSCGTERRGEFSLYREAPVIDEGNGYVGFLTEEQNATGVNKSRYTLLNCATRSVVKIESEVSVAGMQNVGETLSDRIDKLRRRSRLANEAILESEMKRTNYKVTTGTAGAVGADGAERADCGCRRYYWETVRGSRDFVIID